MRAEDFLDADVSEIELGGRKYYVNRELADDLKAADEEMFQETGRNIRISSGYRSRKQQEDIYARHLKGEVTVAAKPGKSRHEGHKGGAVDLINWKEAAPYLRKRGLDNPIPRDPVHFQRSDVQSAEEFLGMSAEEFLGPKSEQSAEEFLGAEPSAPGQPASQMMSADAFLDNLERQGPQEPTPYELPLQAVDLPGTASGLVDMAKREWGYNEGDPRQLQSIMDQSSRPVPDVPLSTPAAQVGASETPSATEFLSAMHTGDFSGIETAPEKTGGPEYSLDRFGGQLREGTKDVARDTLTGLKAILDANVRAGESAEARRAELMPEQKQGVPFLPHIEDQYTRSSRQAREQMKSASSYLGALASTVEKDPMYLESAGFWEDIARQSPQVAAQVLTALAASGSVAVSARVLGGLTPEAAALASSFVRAVPMTGMGLQILGGQYEELTSKGVDPDRAFAAGLVNALAQAPLEQIGLEGILKSFNPTGKAIRTILEASGREAVTEFLQEYPEAATNIWAENPDLTTWAQVGKFIEALPETTKSGLYSGLIGGTFGAVTGGIGVGAGRIVGRQEQQGQPETLPAQDQNLPTPAEVQPEPVQVQPEAEIVTPERQEQSEPAPQEILPEQVEPVQSGEIMPEQGDLQDGVPEARPEEGVPQGPQVPAASTVQQEAEPEKSSYQRLQETAVDDLASLRNSKEIGNSVIGLFGSEEEFNRIDEGELPVNKRWRLANRFAADLHTALVELDLQEADRILSRIKKALKPADFGDQEIRTVGDTPVLDSRPIEEREMQEAEDEKHRQWVKEQEEKQLKRALSRPYAMKSDSKSKSAVPKKSWRSVLGDVNLQSMQKDTGKGDITTGQTPQPEGGETLQSYLRTNTEKHPEGYRGWTSVTDMEPKWHNFGLDKRKHFFNPEEIRSGSAFEIFDFEEKKWFSFKSREEEEAFKEKYPYADLTQNPGDKERVWYRFGPPPESNKSRNYAENKVENGVSVYATPEGSGGAVFFSDREIYSGKGRQVDWGSDGEPVVIPTGKWRKYKPSSNRSTPRNTGGQNIPKEPPAPTSIPTSNVPSSKTETEYSWAVARRNTPVVPAVNVKTIELREEARRSQIIERVRKAFDIPLRQGRFREKALGIYKPGERVIRLKKANDVEVAIHEIGHDLQRLMKFPDKMPAEVRALAYQGAKSKNKEGFAEFVRLYVTNESEARNLAPSFYQAFETKLQERPDIRDAFVTARQAWEEYIAAPSVARVMSLIVSGKDQRKRRFPTFSELYTRLTDEINPLKVMRDAAAKKQGAPIPTARDPYMIAWLNRGWARKAEQFAKWGQFKMTDSGFEKTGPPLREILEPIERQGTRRLLDTYLVAKRAVNDPRIIKGFEGVLRGTDLQQTVTELEPLFSETADQLYKYSDNLFRYLVDSGRISEDAYQSAKKKNLFYAPLYRVIDVDTPARGLSKKRFGNVPNPIKRLKGSSRDIYSPTENILYNTYAMINAAERNQVGAAMIELSQIEGMGEFIEKLPPNLQPVKMDTDEALTILGRSLGIQGDSKAVFLKGLEDLGFTEDDLPELITTFRPNYNTKPNETIFYNKGKPEVYELAPDLYKAIVNTDPSVMHFAMNILAFPAKMLRAGATLTLEFAARNPIRDQFSAFIYSKYGYVPGYDLVKGIFHILKKDTLYQEFNASGAAHAALVSMDRNYLGKSLDDLLNSRGVKNIAKNIIFHPIEALRAFSELTEEATRVGEFERGVRSEMKARGLKPDLTNPFGTGASRTDLMKAGQAARDVTLDFSRVGTEVKSLNAIIAFFNATVQGADKMVRAFRDAPARTLLKTVLSITVPSILLWMAQKDDPYYQEIPGWRKTLFWNIVTHNDDGTVKNIWSIPKPFEIGILFGSFPEAVLDWIYKKDPQGMKKSAEGLWDSLTPGMWPTAAIPILEWWGNKSMFFDRPIVPRGRQDLKPSLQYGPRTAETWKLVAKGFEKVPGLEAVGNPAKLENLFRGYTGGLGAYGTQSVDKIIEALGQSKLPTKPAKGLEDYPGIRGFMWRFPSASTDSIERFYRKYERENTAWESKKDEAGIRGLSKFGVRLPKGSQPDELARLKSIADTMSTLRKMADLTYSNKNLTPEIKREMLDKYYLAMINAARVGLGRKPIEGVRK